MKIKILSLALLVGFLITCGTNDARKDATSVGEGGWAGEGWGGPPEQRGDGKTPRDTKPRDWYYMKYPARASDKAVAKKDQMMMKSTCREAARLQGAADVVRKMIGETLESASGVSDGQSTGQVIVSQSSGVIQGVGVYECLSMGTGTIRSDAMKENWESCECVIYAKYDGGRDALVAKAKAVENKQ
jgi:hypothetical protein